jgi:hypothetical protein
MAECQQLKLGPQVFQFIIAFEPQYLALLSRHLNLFQVIAAVFEAQV